MFFSGRLKYLKKNLFIISGFFCLLHCLAENSETAEALSEDLKDLPAVAHADSKEVEGVLEEFVVTAYRFDALPLDSPVNSTFISSDKLDSSPYSNVAEAIKKFGNINFRSVTGSDASGDLSMRGFGENSQTRILVMVDGQKINRADMGAINWLQIPLSDVESIEILRGPQSALYGSSAEAGVIKITTRRSKENGFNYSAQAYYGSWNTYNLAFRASGRQDENFFSLDLNTLSSDGWRENSAARASSANLSLGWDINSKNTLIVTGNYTDSRTEFPGPLTWEQYVEDARQSDGKGAYSDSKDGVYTATLKNESASGEGEIGLGWNFRDIFWTLGGRSKNFQWTGTVTPRYKFDVGESAHVLVGFDGTLDDIDYKGYYRQTRYYQRMADADRYSLSPYFGGDLKLGEKLIFNAVGRFESSRLHVNNTEYLPNTIEPERVVVIGGKEYRIPNPDYPPQIDPANSFDNSITYNGWSANFGATYLLSDAVSLFFKFDQIYHYPTTDEVASYQGGGLPVPFNFNLKPEQGQNYELGAKAAFEKWTFTASVYLMELIDEIAYYEYVDSSGGVSYTNTNLPPTRRFGTDIEARYDDERWGVGAMFSAVRAEFDGGKWSGKSVPLAPDFYGNLSAYFKPLEWITLSARATFISEQYVGSDYANSVPKLPAYVLVDFQATFDFCRYGNFFLAIENAFDKRYVSCAWMSGYYPGAGRMLKAGVNLKF